MTKPMMHRAALALVLLCGAAMPAVAGDYSFRLFDIPGATSVAVAGINDSGLAAGRFVSASEPNGAGFVGRRGRVTTMALLGTPDPSEPNSYSPNPTGINNRGTVIGTYLLGEQVDDFVWRAGTYVAAFSQSEDAQPSFAPFIGTNDRLSYNEYIGDGEFRAYSGTPASQVLVSNEGFAIVASVNGHGEASGQYTGSVGSTFLAAVFAIVPQGGDTLQQIVPPGAKGAYGGWINDANQIAGSYQDRAGVLHGFIYARGVYTSFDMPVRPDALTTQGIDSTGRVVGTFTKGLTQFAFIYAGGTVSRLRAFSAQDVVHVAISHSGRRIAISQVRQDGTGRSWVTE